VKGDPATEVFEGKKKGRAFISSIGEGGRKGLSSTRKVGDRGHKRNRRKRGGRVGGKVSPSKK